MKPKTIITILIVIALGVGGFFGFRAIQQKRAAESQNYETALISRGSLTAIVGATGTVRANQTAMLAWQTSGRVGEIPVSLGRKVQKGAVLATLAEDSLPQSIILAEADLISAQRSLDSLLNSDTPAAQAQLALVQAQAAYDDAVEDRQSKDYSRASANTVDIARANYIIAQEDTEKYESIYNNLTGLSEDDPRRALALSQLANARKAEDRALWNLNYLLGMPDEGEIAEADARVTLAEAKLADAQREWDRLKDGPDANDIAAAEARIAALQSTLNLVNIKAPFAGTVTVVNSLPGDQVSPGTVSFRLDDLSRLLVDVQVPEVDINRIQPGQTASISFDAITDKTYTGVVVQVGQVGTVVQGVVNFTVTLELETPDESVRPGMTAAVSIVVEQLDDVLLVPNRAVRLREGKRVVYLFQYGVPTPVEIQIGATSDLVSQLLPGEVKEGDAVILNPPSELLTGGPPFMR